MRQRRAVIVGAGIGGLAAAIELAAHGLEVDVLERAASPGGKMREVEVGGVPVDAGPTVITMPWVFEELFAQAGSRFADHVSLKPAEILARHAWTEGGRLDLYADLERSAEAIAAFSSAGDARGYLDFCARARRIYETLDRPFIRGAKPSLPLLLHRIGWHRVRALWCINPYVPLWTALGHHFRDDRLRQLFARYSTYCGGSPFRTPATLMLVAHVEQLGVWLPEGGVHAIAKAMAALAGRLGVRFRYQTEVREIEVNGGRAEGVRLADGEWLPGDAIVVNADSAGLAAGLLGKDAAAAGAPLRARSRSLSALTWCIHARTSGFPLIRHNVFFSPDYQAEFDDIFRRRRPPSAPAVYICAQDREASGAPLPERFGRMLAVVNAPPNGDGAPLSEKERETCEETVFGVLRRCGLQISPAGMSSVMTTPQDFERLFPGSGGALYGRAPHGWMASFRRPGSRTRLAGLYLAGGSTHPGAGVPMAAISGRLAASSVLADLALTYPSYRVAMPGGISMRSARIGAAG
jgi:1-hydroxycarotenoid 3,4-desaturase